MKPADKWSQFERIETFAFIALLAVTAILASCKSTQTTPVEYEKVYIHMSDGDSLELVADEYGNQYLKQHTYGHDIYTPYPGETEDQSDTLKFFNAKNK